MIEWFVSHLLATSAVTFFLMWSSWLFMILLERVRPLNHSEHFGTYPVATTEVFPGLNAAVKAKRIFDPKHVISALFISVFVVPIVLASAPPMIREAMIGFIWGIYLIVDMMHLSNLLGYWAMRQGVQGKLFLHQRTSYLTQVSRYIALSFFLILLAACSASFFIWGVAVAGITSVVRLLIFLRKIPGIDVVDGLPSNSPSPGI